MVVRPISLTMDARVDFGSLKHTPTLLPPLESDREKDRYSHFEEPNGGRNFKIKRKVLLKA